MNKTTSNVIHFSPCAMATVLIGFFLTAHSLSAEPQRYTAGEELQDCDSCPVMVVLPVGDFMMGSPAGDQGWRDVERPQHTVVIESKIAVGKYEVTFAQWDECVSDGGCESYSPDDEGWGRGLRPVINVNWHDAISYTVWLSRKTGKAYRLLSEAEWEYAARAGTTSEFHWGDQASRKDANFGVEGCCGGHAEGGDQWIHTAPVGSFAPNFFGLHDMHGNVWEWVEDCRIKSYDGASSAALPRTDGNCNQRRMRGGSWYFKSSLMRSAFRGWSWAADRGNGIGFRVARTLDPVVGF